VNTILSPPLPLLHRYHLFIQYTLQPISEGAFKNIFKKKPLQKFYQSTNYHTQPMTKTNAEATINQNTTMKYISDIFP
jgi:hypothetical protein